MPRSSPLADMTPEQRSAVAKRAAAARWAKQHAQESAAPPSEAPPDVPPNYGNVREVGSGGAITPAARAVGGLGEHATVPVAAAVPPPRQPRGSPRKEAPEPVYPRVATVLTLPDWEVIEPHEGQQILDTLYKVLEAAAKILQRRLGQLEAAEGYRCETCGVDIPSVAQAKMIQDGRDPASGMLYRHVWCSSICFTRYVSEGRMARPVPPGASLTRREGE